MVVMSLPPICRLLANAVNESCSLAVMLSNPDDPPDKSARSDKPELLLAAEPLELELLNRLLRALRMLSTSAPALMVF